MPPHFSGISPSHEPLFFFRKSKATEILNLERNSNPDYKTRLIPIPAADKIKTRSFNSQAKFKPKTQPLGLSSVISKINHVPFAFATECFWFALAVRHDGSFFARV